MIESLGNSTRNARTGIEWRVEVDDLSFSTAEAAMVNYDADGSGSLYLEVIDDGLLTDYEGETAKVLVRNVQLGEDFEEYFTGRIDYTEPDGETGHTVIEAHGPRAALSGSFGEAVVYQGISLGAFVYDIRRRLGRGLPRLKVIGGEAYRIDLLECNPEVEFREAIEEVIETAGYFVGDRPGYNLLVAPEPVTGTPVDGDEVVHISPQDYGPGGCRVTPSSDGPYSRVIAFRRDDDGREVWRVEVSVRGSTAPPSAIKWLTDFEGDYASAKQTCYVLAGMYARGYLDGRVTALRADHRIFPKAALRVVQDVRRAEGISGETKTVRKLYSGTVRTLALDLIGATMEVNFVAELASERDLTRTEAWEGPSAYVRGPLPAGPIKPGEEDNIGEDLLGLYVLIPPQMPEGYPEYYGEDSEGLYILLDDAENNAGEDEDGLWINEDS